ncbi:MAG: hypothetical protein NVV66_00130 [Cellulomonas sp.]|uniref:hypothetical protein n=1 Tax=Cellulomonas sp. TaxID=40001 RepID=UPI002588C58A|nr:hypothetical protein [Cellulomonas sp.]MCR6703161.1 hypothetical protein [Cellulomonas sp.]
MSITIGSHGLIEEEIVWKVAQGADARATFTLWEDVDRTTPTDLTGFTGACQVRAKLGGALLGTAIVTVGEAAGTVDVHLPAAASTAWSPRQVIAVFDVELTAPGGAVTRLCSGSLDVLPNATTGDLT